jgi:hypothetical protein
LLTNQKDVKKTQNFTVISNPLKKLQIKIYYETADVAQLSAKLAGRMRKKYFVQGQLEQPSEGQKSLLPA